MKKKDDWGFNKRESIDRDKYDQRTFLNKYIKRYKSYTSMMRWLLPMVVIVNLVLVVIIYFTNYMTNGKHQILVISIFWSIATIIWIF